MDSFSVCVCVLSCLVVSYSWKPHGLQPTSSSCPWDSPGKNTGVGCHFLLQGIFPTQGWNLCLLRLPHWQEDSLPLNHLGSPILLLGWLKCQLGFFPWMVWKNLNKLFGQPNYIPPIIIFPLQQAIHLVRLKLQVCLVCDERQLPSQLRLLLVLTMLCGKDPSDTGVEIVHRIWPCLSFSPFTISPPTVLVALGSVLWGCFWARKIAGFLSQFQSLLSVPELQLPSRESHKKNDKLVFCPSFNPCFVVVHCSISKSCSTICDPVNCSTPGFPVLHYLPEFAQTQAH